MVVKLKLILNTDRGMKTEEIFEEMTASWMSDSNAARLFGFQVGSRFDDEYSKVSVLRLLMWVVSWVIAKRETLLEEWKAEVEKVANETHYGTSAWWIAKAKDFQYGDSLVVEDGKVQYAEEHGEKKIVSAASVTVVGRTLLLKVAKGVGGGLSGLSDSERSSFEGYVQRIKPLGLMVVVQSGSGNELRVKGEVRYSGERKVSEIAGGVREALERYVKDLEFNGTIYAGRMTKVIIDVDGVVDVHITGMELDGVAWEDSVIPGNGYVVLNVEDLTYRGV